VITIEEYQQYVKSKERLAHVYLNILKWL